MRGREKKHRDTQGRDDATKNERKEQSTLISASLLVPRSRDSRATSMPSQLVVPETYFAQKNSRLYSPLFVNAGVNIQRATVAQRNGVTGFIKRNANPVVCVINNTRKHD